MDFDPVAASFALGGFVVVAAAPSPSWGSIGAGAACAFVALLIRLRPTRRAQKATVQDRPNALLQQVLLPGPIPSDGLPGLTLDQTHAALLMPVQDVGRSS
ncbi:MAG: hypothetical protein EOO77_16805 [Oxalobacteraceae bacterium]|nr:MAG: hypothetical protein EOO77_16805 [Oxalobacteraceae bacterium]